MYNNSHPDPFAGQYPPPPPLQSPVTEAPSTIPLPPPQPYQPEVYHQTTPTYQPEVYPAHPEVYPPHPEVYPAQTEVYHSQPHIYTPQETYPPPQDVYSPPPTKAEYYNHQPYYNPHVAITPLDEIRPAYRQDDSLDDYLRKEREEYLKHEEPVRQNSSAPLYNIKAEEYDEPEKAPMVQKQPSLSRKERKKLEKLQKQQVYQPYMARPTLAPENEADSYRPKPYAEQNKSNCCCCYNPAITCCSFFCLLISVAFCAAGVAMMIASKVVTDKCTNQCANVIDQAQNACGTICSKVLHDGMLYGGAVVAGLAGIAIIWKIIMWTCAGYSKR